MELTLLLGITIWAVVFGGLSARQASAVHRPVVAWAAFGAVLGPVALALLHAAPPGRCRRCDERVRGWEYACRYCGEDVRGITAARSVAAREAAAGTATPPIPRAHAAPPSEAVADPRSGAEDAERLAANTRKVQHSTAVSATRAGPRPAGPAPLPPPGPVSVAPPEPVPVAPPEPVSAAPRPAAAQGGTRRRRGREQPDPGRTIGAGLFLTGSASLQPGFRYAIAVSTTRLRILGPLDLDPEKVVMDRDLAPFDATVTEDRVMLTEGSPDRPRMFLVFERITGTTPAGLADEIVRAVHAVPRAG